MNRAFWYGRRVFVTGHTGFKGSWLSHWLSRVGSLVSGYALAPTTEPNLFNAATVDARINSQFGDIRDLHRLTTAITSFEPEIIFHLAAQPLVRSSYETPIETFHTNVLGTANVLEAIRNSPSLRAVVVITTDKCYENQEWVWPYREGDRLGGSDPYAASKACAELVVTSYRRSYFSQPGAPGLATARGGNVVGGGDWSADRIIPDLVRSFVSGVPATIRNPEAVRPWQSVLDALHGYILLAENLFENAAKFSGAWNIGPPTAAEMTVRQVADIFANSWQDGASWRYVPDPAGPHEARLLTLDTSKARVLLNWRDASVGETAIRQAAEWYQKFYLGDEAAKLMSSAIDSYEKGIKSNE